MSEGESDVSFIKDTREGVLRGTDDGQTDKLRSKILGCSPLLVGAQITLIRSVQATNLVKKMKLNKCELCLLYVTRISMNRYEHDSTSVLSFYYVTLHYHYKPAYKLSVDHLGMTALAWFGHTTSRRSSTTALQIFNEKGDTRVLTDKVVIVEVGN
jgi:hypothetical protein